MKKHLILLSFLMAATFAQAQFIVSGQLDFSSLKQKYSSTGSSEESSLTSLTLIPRLAYSFGDIWAGIDVGITNATSKSPNFTGGTDEDKYSIISVGPFVRFIKRPSDRMGVWAELQAGFGSGKSTSNGTDEYKYSSISAGLRPGVIFFISDRLSFEASYGRLGFNSTTQKPASGNTSDEKVTTSNFGLGLNSNNYQVNFLNEEDLRLTGGFNFAVNWMF
ncbi:MAG TPA: outer membrane beta-barrel protein [Saprospiraceae bacterium]|nr:outer membrane beta-barrel protein [Saprospiraceae bacterium]HNG89445.1 outer membrane beta-barrel protein [Saprospiraceae bacterium]